MIRIEKTAYDKPERSDGKRVLVVKIWPTGISKDRVDLLVPDLGTDRELMKRWKAGEIPGASSQPSTR